ncbi:hypothetical protein VNO77_09750 [Canavalia gladiata]|uniref:Uncharacterized protein n=1 Tax=Canavalia gladiata TaxID=3824 RepID=A0AAN9MG80_CANGL
MAEESSPSPPPPPYVEVNCRSSGKTRRFAVGTDAGFAVALINRRLKGTVALASHIEAVKNGEEPIAFGPTSILANIGEGWNLQTVTLTDTDLVSSEEVGNGHVRKMATQTPGLAASTRRVSKPIGFAYIVKIVFAFILIFVLGALFTLFLDNLPAFILFVKSTM